MSILRYISLPHHWAIVWKRKSAKDGVYSENKGFTGGLLLFGYQIKILKQ